MDAARNLLTNTSTKGKVVLAASVLGVVLFMVFMLRLATAPSYSTIMTGLDPADTGKITSALDEKGIEYELQNNGTALAVDKSKVPDARIALAEGGLPKKGQPGYELFDKQKLGSSDFQQKVTYQRALEGEISGTIEQIDGVNGAQVDLVLPEDELFEDEQSQAKAAVLLNADGASLEPGTVQGIARLTSSAVKGLQDSNVTITDQGGQLLWPREGAEGVTSATSKQAVEGRFAQDMEASLNALLTQTLGPGKGRVEVRADLNADEITRDELTYADEGTPLRQKTENEELEGGGGAGGAPAGTAGNIPGYGAGAGGGGGSNYNREAEETDFGVNKTVTRTKVAPGAVNRLDVAVLVDKSIPPADLTELETALQSAAGVDQGRGDTLTVSQMTFAKPPAPKKEGAAANVLGYLKWVGLGLAMLAFLFFVTRHLKKREGESLGEPTWLRELNAPTPLAALERGQANALPERAQDSLRTRAADIAGDNPERVAHQVRAWMNA